MSASKHVKHCERQGDNKTPAAARAGKTLASQGVLGLDEQADIDASEFQKRRSQSAEKIFENQDVTKGSVSALIGARPH